MVMSVSENTVKTHPSPSGEPVDATPDNAVEATEKAQALLLDIDSLRNSKDTLDEHAIKHLRKRSNEISQWLENETEIQHKIEKGLTKLRERVLRQTEQRKHDIADIEKLLAQMENTLEDGQLKNAASAHHAVQRKLDKIPDLADEHRHKIMARLEQAEPRLKELNAWRHWGTSIARENLIEQVRTLHETEKSPVKIANAIREARKTWQEWDKSGDSGGRELWERFDATCSEAYQPCKKYFDERSAERAGNLLKRENICASLEEKFQAVDWRNPDWRSIDKFIGKTKRDWRTAGPVDRKAKKQIEQRFERICDQFEDYLERERTRDNKRRSKLIEAVRALSEKDNIEDAIEEVKKAQKEWSPTVLGHRRLENQLWKEFKTACDAVFERRGQQKQAEGEQRRENLQAKQQICADLEQQISQSTDDSFNADSLIAQARDRWHNIGEVPRKEENNIEKRFKRACSNVNKHAKTLANQAKAKSLEVLQQQAQLCCELEALALTGTSSRSAEELTTAWQTPRFGEQRAATRTALRVSD